MVNVLLSIIKYKLFVGGLVLGICGVKTLRGAHVG
jgi:hypothetical protein